MDGATAGWANTEEMTNCTLTLSSVTLSDHGTWKGDLYTGYDDTQPLSALVDLTVAKPATVEFAMDIHGTLSAHEGTKPVFEGFSRNPAGCIFVISRAVTTPTFLKPSFKTEMIIWGQK